MISAFGIEHGDEVSKIRLPGAARGRVRPVAPARSKKIKDALNRAGETPITVKGVGRASGRAVTGVGNIFEGHPGLTGTALVGGGGYGGYRYLSHKEPRKKR